MDRENTDAQPALRRIPSLDAFLRHRAFELLPRAVLLRESRAYLANVRGRALAGELDEVGVGRLFDTDDAARQVCARCAGARAAHHRTVINATGVVLHTGLGRAPLARAAAEAISAAAGYAVVELDPRTGQRNEREVAVASLLRDLLGVEGALVVNNNAGAANLMLAALAAGREVIVSRGELVEIGGGFRVPDVMRQAGCTLVEVGTTNRTRVRDYEAAITPETAMLLKVHPSNFRVVGFTEAPALAELVALALRHPRLLVCEDLGSGLLMDQPIAGLEDEPRVRASLAAGPHLVCFSGDKLLGGPQCGIIVGDGQLAARCRAHPLYRAFRCDKLTLAALEATLRIYRDGNAFEDIPTLRALSATPAELERAAAELEGLLPGLGAEVVATQSFAGAGANPARPLPSHAVAFAGGDAELERLRAGPDIPVFARLEKGRVLLDLRTLVGEDLRVVAAAVRANLSGAAPRDNGRTT
jgi:L-seryl-tRNA(Ser) seleniumtransferase